MEPLISHTFPLMNAPEAYDIILERKEAVSGIIIEYDVELQPERQVRLVPIVFQKIMQHR